MYNSYMYILANEGIDTSSSYAFKERVSTTSIPQGEIRTLLL